MRERMLREARALGGLSHPNVITVYDVVDVGGEPMVVLEMVPSRNLATLISEQGVLSTAQSAVVGFATAAALRAAHRAGITHRDVKPGNVLVAHDGQVKLTDFGIARNVADAPMTTAGLVLGSPAYIAPEVAAGQPVTPAADLWGLGRDAVRRDRGTPAVRRARRPGLDDHRGGRRRGPAAERERPRHRRDRRAHGQGACEADAAGRGAAAAAPADRRPRRPALPGLAGRADDGRHLPGAPGVARWSGGIGAGELRRVGPGGPSVGADADGHPGAACDVGRTACRTFPASRAGRTSGVGGAARGVARSAARGAPGGRTGPAPAPDPRPVRPAPDEVQTEIRPPAPRPAAHVGAHRRGPRGGRRGRGARRPPRGLGGDPRALGTVAADDRDGGDGRGHAAGAHRRPRLHRSGAGGLGRAPRRPVGELRQPGRQRGAHGRPGRVRGGGPGGTHRRGPRYGRPAARPAAGPGRRRDAGRLPHRRRRRAPDRLAARRAGRPTACWPCGSPPRAAVPRACPRSCSTSSRTRSARRADREPSTRTQSRGRAYSRLRRAAGKIGRPRP